MTDAAASVDPTQHQGPGPGFALHVSVDETSGAAGRLMLADLAHRVVSLVAELAPSATAHSVLAVTERHDVRAMVARVGEEIAAQVTTPSAVERAEALWRPVATHQALVVVDIDAREVVVRGEVVPLTYKEFGLLEHLVRRPHHAASREELLREVWRKELTAGTTRTVDVHVRRLREKLGGCLQIVTVRGVGYRWDPTPDIVLVGSGDAG